MSGLGHHKDQAASKYSTPSELLIPMIGGGRCFELKGNAFRFNKEDGSFISTRWGGVDTAKMCELLLGKVLTEVDPVHIPVDTPLLVSQWLAFEKGETLDKPPLTRYFSHWDRGELYCFADGTTSLTAVKTERWQYYKHFDTVATTDKTDDNAEIKNDDPFMDKTNK